MLLGFGSNTCFFLKIKSSLTWISNSYLFWIFKVHSKLLCPVPWSSYVWAWVIYQTLAWITSIPAYIASSLYNALRLALGDLSGDYFKKGSSLNLSFLYDILYTMLWVPFSYIIHLYFLCLVNSVSVIHIVMVFLCLQIAFILYLVQPFEKLSIHNRS